MDITTEWAIQDNELSFSQTWPLMDVLNEKKIKYTPFGIVPFSEDFPLPELSTDKVIPYGSTTLMKRLIKGDHNWKGFFFDEYTFKPSIWREELGKKFFNEDGVTMSIKDAHRYLASNKHYHIRPNSDLKTFCGHVVLGKDFKAWCERVELGDYFQEETEIFISKVKYIPCEFRWFIIGGRIVEGSSYGQGIQPFRYIDPFTKFQKMADKWLPSECCVMDTTDSKVLEFNCINCSGFYGHDIANIVNAFTKYVGEL